MLFLADGFFGIGGLLGFTTQTAHAGGLRLILLSLRAQLFTAKREHLPAARVLSITREITTAMAAAHRR